MSTKKKRKLNIKLIILTILLFLIICVFLLRFVVFNNSTNKYGNRLDSIKNISLTDKNKKEIKDSLKADSHVTETSLNVKGKIINILISVNDETSAEDARNLSNIVLEKISDKIKNAYDIQVFISKKNTTDDDKEFPMIGYKNLKSDKFIW